MKRNYHIQLYRFIAALLIMILHWNAARKIPELQGGYIWVEFFFIVSGFLMAAKVLPNKSSGAVPTIDAAQSAWQYTKKKFLNLFPYSITGTLAMFIGVSIVLNYKLTDIIKKFIDTFWEMSLLFMSGIGGTNYRFNGQAWFVSALLIVGYFVYYFLKKYPDFYSRIFAPASVLLIYAFFWNKYTHICKAATFDTDISAELALIRALAGLNLGILCYVIYDRYKDCKPNKFCRLVLSAAELFAFVFVILMTYKFSYTNYDYVLIFVLAVIVVLSFLDFGYGKALYENKVVDFLGRLSMPIFFNHVFTYSIILRNSSLDYGMNVFVYYVITLAISAVEYLAYEAIRKSIAKRIALKKEGAANIES